MICPDRRRLISLLLMWALVESFETLPALPGPRGTPKTIDTFDFKGECLQRLSDRVEGVITPPGESRTFPISRLTANSVLMATPPGSRIKGIIATYTCVPR
jgi:hypothetical protein